jgi:hypothetical protein
MSKQVAIMKVLDGLRDLIAMGAAATVNREFNPTYDADSDGDTIAAGRRQVVFLRDMREQLENVLLLGRYEVPSIDKWLDTPQVALDNHTPRQMGVKAP